MRAEAAEEWRVERREGGYEWWEGMGRLWVELAVEECVNLEGWVEGLRGVVGGGERDGEGERGEGGGVEEKSRGVGL